MLFILSNKCEVILKDIILIAELVRVYSGRDTNESGPSTGQVAGRTVGQPSEDNTTVEKVDPVGQNVLVGSGSAGATTEKVNPWKMVRRIDPDGWVLKKLEGWFAPLQMMLPDGEMILWKVGKARDNIREVAGSRFTSYLMGGYVPIASLGDVAGEPGGYQPFLSLECDIFLKQAKLRELDLSDLTNHQLHELFCHGLANRLVGNGDSHQKQYGIGKDTKRVYGLDKSHIFYFYEKDKQTGTPSRDLDFARDIWFTPQCLAKKDEFGDRKYVPIDAGLAQQVLERKIMINPNHPILEAFFKRCEEMSKEMIEDFLGHFAEQEHPQDKEEFFAFVLDRAHTMKSVVYKYFGWEHNSRR